MKRSAIRKTPEQGAQHHRGPFENGETLAEIELHARHYPSTNPRSRSIAVSHCAEIISR